MNDNDVRESVALIAAHLEGWEVSGEEGPRSNACYLVGPEDTRVTVSQPWNEKGKLEFGVSLEPGLHDFEAHRSTRPSCKVSADRDPAAVARDVKRRCLDMAVPYVQELREKRRIHDAERAARRLLIDGLAAALGGDTERARHDDDPMEAKARRGAYDDPEASAKLVSGPIIDTQTWEHGPDRVEMELKRLPFDLALDLCAWLRARLWPEQPRLL